jgi:hypothetical protein
VSRRAKGAYLLEPDVALTDFALAAECAAMAAWLHWRSAARGVLGTWFVIFFAATGIGALLGGIAHGFFPSTESVIDRSIWIATLLAIGVAALAVWAIAGHLLFAEPAAKRVLTFAAAAFAIYFVLVCLLEAFVVAVIFYVPASTFLLVAFVITYFDRRRNQLLAGIAGVVLSFVAAAIQLTETAVPSLGLSHNALYHLVQAVALLLIFVAALDIARMGAGDCTAA